MEDNGRPIRGSKLEEFPSQPEIKRSCQWVHRHHPRPSQPSLGMMVKWWVAAPSGLEKLDHGEPRRSGKTTTIPRLVFVRGSSTPYLRVRDGGLMLPHIRASSRRGYDPDGPVVIFYLGGPNLKNSRASWRSRGVFSGYTDIILDRYGRLWE
ncbi:hypothetical protein EVAR_41595_1 [Eumeta japonica]|uniref:Uncharacterized protein n=1 Tax=Eumeta variegata TaxID=151549 RepID=A0A4C1Y799_EUMVA|nr:hypothetical protein EVAR_41595_1 [Eumeta japonica]